MKRIILKELTLVNWRGSLATPTEFDPVCTTIAGANGLGKSRHFDAFTWLLFGKDSQDRKDYNIKSIREGDTTGRSICGVRGTFEVDGEIVELKRNFKEEWVKPRGATEEVFKGNKTECFWNDTPVSVTEYAKRVQDIIDDTLFKMLTNPAYFLSMPWKDQREQLFQMAGAVEDSEVATWKPEFADFLDRLAGKPMADFKRELAVRKRLIKSQLDEVQPRIDQTYKLMPEKQDFAALEAEMKSIDDALVQVDGVLTSVAERSRKQYEEVQARQDEINDLKDKRQKVIFDAKSKANEDAYKANEELTDLREKEQKAKREKQGYKADIESATKEIARLESRKKGLTKKADELREEWYKVNASAYNGETTCSCCGQELPAEMQASAKDHFDKLKADALAKITEQGKSIKEDVARLDSQIEEVQEDERNANEGIARLSSELEELKARLAEVSEVKPEEIKPEDIQEYNDLTEQITALEATIDDGIESEDTTIYQEKKIMLTTKRDEIKDKLTDRKRIEDLENSIKKLKEDGRDLAHQLAEAEREEYTMQQFTKAKIDECEKRINNLFTMVTFQLFDYTIEDAKKENPIECCIPLINGVPVGTTNTAAKVNAGLDIINALCRFYGVTAPIFIDNRESITEIIPTDSQIINLKVTDDKLLVVTKGK
ncbi:MAG: hypothetical protein D8H91_05020 [Alloprevotella sp.]|nr:MAG: hypothetical protein D8H91_05020 [Alloprevotella sp.]